ncbi:hypothetical protein AAFC00_004776 [Neodothiora populina]|uniref:GPI mannosyltransferase 2 n=1 Tax=Neodothiora populina TaxID=2781224 RepID=A0ABR3P3F1_9PEZI
MPDNNVSSVRLLLLAFVIWKALLLCIACASPGPGYDTSTQLLLASGTSQTEASSIKLLGHIASRLVRWDALYFVRVAQRGHVFEQEWAWGFGWTKSIHLGAKVLSSLVRHPLLVEALAGILISHACHLLSVLLLFQLAKSIVPTKSPQRDDIAFVAAMLHIVSPAGVFLSAPYSESLFACLTFLGMLCYAHVYHGSSGMVRRCISVLASGVCWGLASTVRGNGLLNGLILLSHALGLLGSLRSLEVCQELLATLVAGLTVALGNALPQWIGYQQFCPQDSTVQIPIWCSRIPPSIYTYVQAHYWNNGFLRYWTLSNIPLFALAIPMLALLSTTALIAVFQPILLLSIAKKVDKPSTPKLAEDLHDADRLRYVRCMRLFALPQAALALLALFNFHVQIINRLSSAYPVWYLVLAIAITTNDAPIAAIPSPGINRTINQMTTTLVAYGKKRSVQRVVVSSMVIYAIVQDGLYASFMPPA